MQASARLLGGMDFQNRAGSKGGGLRSESRAEVDRKERLRKLAMETFDLAKDPYLLRNHVGSFECKLCLTLHKTEENYLSHTQGRKHQTNLLRRAAMDRKREEEAAARYQAAGRAAPRARTIKIGRPAYTVTKSRDVRTLQRTLLFTIEYPEAKDNVQPRHRFMSAYEQKVEPPDRRYQYLLFACEPYETVAFKVPNEKIDRRENRFVTNWDFESKTFTLQFYYEDGQAT